MLRCAGCGSEAISKHGEPSILDGKRGWLCESCGLEMAPCRSKAMLWFMVAAFAVMTAACAVAAVTLFVNPLVLGRPIRHGKPVTLAFLAFGAAGTVLAARELRKVRPVDS